jgi:imidazolonepropionase-like amidohydrolase
MESGSQKSPWFLIRRPSNSQVLNIKKEIVMIRKIISSVFITLASLLVYAQDDVYPAPEHKGLMFIKNATIHVGNGDVIENGTIEVRDGKIVRIGKDIAIPADDVKVFDIKGSHAYPGLILSNSSLGLIEISSVRSTADVTEIGALNASIRSIVAYNTDSKVINTLKSNGILLANIVPQVSSQGGLISGSSSVVQLDAWNWEDAAYKTDHGIHLFMPSLFVRPNPFQSSQQSQVDPIKRSLSLIEKTKEFFREAKGYFQQSEHGNINLKFEGVRGLFEKKQKLFVHCDIVKEILVAIDFKKEFAFEIVIVGGSESWEIAQLLKQNDIQVILSQLHRLPTLADDDVDQPYKTPALLQKAGVVFAINDEDGSHRGRNLAFNAGTAVAYGLTKEQAISAITLNAAKILGISERTGSLEAGKDANIVISQGDILDMRSSTITHAFIVGRMINLEDKHKQLFERYKYKYGIK